MKSLDCIRCPDKIVGSAAYVSDSLGAEQGPSHYRCYHLAHPPTLARTVSDVIRCPHDPAVARQIIARLALQHINEVTAVDEYNFALIEGWKRRIAI